MRRRREFLAAGAVLALSIFAGPDSRAGCGDLGAYAPITGGLLAIPVAVTASFGVPAIAVAADDSLNYWGGVGYSAAGAFTLGAKGFGVTLIDCPPVISHVLPGVMALTGSIVTTTIWAFATTGDDPKPFLAVGIEPQIGDGAVVTLSGQF